MPSVVLCSVIIGINLFLWIIFFVQFKKKFAAEKVIAEVRDVINKMLVDIQSETDRSIVLLDARREGLQKLLDEAKRYTELANADVNRQLRSQSILASLQSEKNGAKKTDSAQSLFSLTDLQQDRVEISEDATTLAKETASTKPIPTISTAPTQVKIRKDLRVQVLELSAEGFSSDIIAQKLGVSITEVELIIDMYGI
ncbi:MAG: hypothetical protein J6B81_00055 [Spirochaetaceae bacterium]|nr:hypothetical protein [Spirochaetaceae bacterium]